MPRTICWLRGIDITPFMASDREKTIYKVTLLGSAANVLLTVFKFVAGILGHSSAMIADAVHSLSDLLSDIVVLVFVKLAGKPKDADHNYGHGKYETLASVIVGLMLAAVGIGLLIEGVRSTIAFFQGEELGAPNWWALSAALISIVIKEGLYRYTVWHGRKVESGALIANAWHHRSDAFTSIATLVGIGGAMLLGAKWRVLDPLAAAVVSLFIVKAAWDLIKPAIDELLEKSLPEEEQQQIAAIIASTPGVTNFHRLRTRRIGSQRAIEVHIKMPGDITLAQAHDIASDVERRLRDSLGEGTHIGIHMEPQQF